MSTTNQIIKNFIQDQLNSGTELIAWTQFLRNDINTKREEYEHLTELTGQYVSCKQVVDIIDKDFLPQYTIGKKSLKFTDKKGEVYNVLFDREQDGIFHLNIKGATWFLKPNKRGSYDLCNPAMTLTKNNTDISIITY